MDQVSSIYNPGNDFFWREEGPCRARARTSPARPSLGVPPTRCGGFPVTALSQTRLNLQVSGSLGQPAWFATVPWTGTSRSQVGVPPRISSFVRRQLHSKKQTSLYIERVQFSSVAGARKFSLEKRILTRHPCESSLVFYRRKSPKINKRVHFLTKSAKKRPPPSPPYILCGPGPGRAPPGLPPGGAPVCGLGGSPVHGILICTNRSQSSSEQFKRPTSPVCAYPVDGNPAYPEAPNLEITLAGEVVWYGTY